MSKHKTTSNNLFEKINANNVMVNKWAVIGVDGNVIDCTVCRKPVPINHGGMDQVNQHVFGKTHRSFSDESFQVLSLDSLKVLQLAKPGRIMGFQIS